jgi:hypothetical protein
LIIYVLLLTFGVRKRQKFFVKWVKNCTLSAFLNFASLFSKLKKSQWDKDVFLC